MTRDDIIRIAREAGFKIGSISGAIYAPTPCESALERFAFLVAEQAREDCAKACAEVDGEYDWLTARRCAEAILERGEQ